MGQTIQQRQLKVLASCDANPPTLMPNRILPSGTGYWDITLYPIGGSFHRTILDTPVTVERTFKNYHGATAQGRIVATGIRIAYSLDLTQPE